MYVPELELNAVTVSVELAAVHWLHGGTGTVEGVSVTVGSVGFDGVTVAVRGTVWLYKLNVLISIVALPFWPGNSVRVGGLALSEYEGLQNWPFRHDILHAVTGCISQPEKAWPGSFAWSGSQ